MVEQAVEALAVVVLFQVAELVEENDGHEMTDSVY
jgi:hypothetical protein